jgi:signal transduction histidine kinase
MRRPWSAWLFIGALFVLCAVLGVLQYEWIGKASDAARDQLRAALHVNLIRLSQDFNGEIATAFRALLPTAPADVAEAEEDIVRRLERARKGAHGVRIFRRIGFAAPVDGSVGLKLLDLQSGELRPVEWPAEWESTRRMFEARLAAMGGLPMGMPWREPEGLVFETPIFAPAAGRGRPEHGQERSPFGGRPFGRREMAWMIFDLSAEYLRDSLLPEVVQRHLTTSEYAVEVLARSSPGATIWASDGNAAGIAHGADSWVGLVDLKIGGFPDGGRGRGGRGPGPDSGRWTLYVRHRAGSLDAVVAQTRWRNLGVTGGVLLLLVATSLALLRFTRNAERLAHMQMDFVAGVSHELRTPLTAIYTAGHNLRGRLAQNPAQVERYGEMIQQESGRLRDLVEQVLRFASANAGRVIQKPAPVSVERVIEETLESSRCSIQAAGFMLEKQIDEGLPPILGDSLALKHALHNLITNAVKYGAKDDPWIRISASAAADSRGSTVEIRVADRGPGIPEEEQKLVFDAFYRGERAVQDQIHGAGLGLNLVKKIVEAHGGSIRVKSAPGKGAEFIVRIPAAPAGATA